MNGATDTKSAGDERRSFDYGRLRSWYLATLRKRIVDLIESGALTPSARISADREAMYKLIADASVKDQATVHQEAAALPTSGKTLLIALIVLPFLCQIPIAFVLIGWREAMPAGAWWSLMCMTIIGSLLSTFALVSLYEQLAGRIERYIQSRLSCLFAAGSLVPRYERPGSLRLGALDEMVKFLCDLVLQEAEREHAIADYALDFFCALDPQGRFCAASPSSSEYFGLSPAELQGKHFCDFVYGADFEKTIRTIAAISKASGAIPFETRIKHQNGAIIDVAWHAEWSRNEAACFCIGKNISSQRRLERTKQEFISMVGHDLKTPITSIDCTLELLADGATDGHQLLVENARGSIADLLRLINQILELERMEDGQMPITKQKTELSSVLNRSVGSVASYAQREELEITVAATDLSVSADAEKLQQVVINLLANAIKFSPKNSSISISVVMQEGSKALVSISDEGPGIPIEYHETIFERFQQVSARDRSYGSGLGLSISRAIIQAHGGTIGVDSEPGKGSTFWFTVPLTGR